MLPTKNTLQLQRQTKEKVKEWQNIFHGSRNQKKAGVAITISHKKDFKPKTVIKDKGDLLSFINNKRVNL